MKKFKLFAAIFTVLFLSAFVTNDLYATGNSKAGDKWEISSVKAPASCKLKATSLAFKIKIKNTGSIKTSGESIKVKVKLTYSQFTEYEEFDLKPGKTAAGKTSTISVTFNKEGFFRPNPTGDSFTGTAGTKHVNASYEIIGAGNSKLIEEVDIRVK